MSSKLLASNCIRVLLILISIYICSPTAAQTKKETVDWLNSKFNKNPIVYGDVFKFSQKMKINQDGTFEIISTDYEVPINPSNPEVASRTIIKGNFNNLSPSSITVRKSNGLLFIDIKCLGGNDCLSVSTKGDAGISYDKSGVAFGAYYDEEENIGNRLKKAFTRLIKLCGGKAEAF
jgi:hypothetical protein